MNVKGVDLQFAIHKNDEAGIKQSQHMQRPMNDQVLLGHEANQTLQKERTRTGKVNESAGRRVKGDQEEKEPSRQQGSRQGGKQPSQAKPEEGGKPEEAPKHPYKGRHIDLTL